MVFIVVYISLSLSFYNYLSLTVFFCVSVSVTLSFSFHSILWTLLFQCVQVPFCNSQIKNQTNIFILFPELLLYFFFNKLLFCTNQYCKRVCRNNNNNKKYIQIISYHCIYNIGAQSSCTFVYFPISLSLSHSFFENLTQKRECIQKEKKNFAHFNIFAISQIFA